MAKQTINTGQAPNDGTGDQLYIAFDKVNSNNDEIYTAGPVGSDIQIQSNAIRSTLLDSNLDLIANGNGTINLLSNTVIGDITKTLLVNGDTTFNEDVVINGSLTANASVILTNTLSVSSTSTLSTLVTTGLANINSLTTVTNADIGSTLSVSGTSTLSTLITTGLSTLNSLDVTNNTTVSGTLNVLSDTTVDGTLDITGTATAADPIGSIPQELVTVQYLTDNGGSGGGQVDSIVAGTNITVDNTDPVNPVISGTASAGMTSWTVGDITNTLDIADGDLLSFTSADGNIVPTVGTDLDLKLADDIAIANNLTVTGQTFTSDPSGSIDNGVVNVGYFNDNKGVVEEVVDMIDQANTTDDYWTGTVTNQAASNIRLQFNVAAGIGLPTGLLTLPTITADTPQIVNITYAFDSEVLFNGNGPRVALTIESNGNTNPIFSIANFGNQFQEAQTGTHIICEVMITNNATGYPEEKWVCYMNQLGEWSIG